MAGGDSTPTLVDHDGFVEAFYHMLWAKNFNGEPCPEVLVPDTIIYKYRIPAYWYFTGSDGRLRRKNKANIVNQKIFKDFTAGARSEKDVVALHICERPIGGDAAKSTDEAPARMETVVRYFDKATLKDFLFVQEKLDDGCLQKFVRPKGLFNSMIQAAWSPQMCLIERRVNQTPLLSGRVPIDERTATYEGSEHLSRITPVRGTLLADRVQHVCTEMVTHIAATSHHHQRITRSLLNFKTDVEDNVWFLWCGSVRVADDAPPTADPAAAATAAAASSAAGGAPSPSKRSAGALASSSSGMLTRSSSSALAPVCLDPTMSSLTKPRLSKAMKAVESVCPFTGHPLGGKPPYFVTYKTILEYSNVLDARLRIKRPPTEVPPLLAKVCPDLDGERYYKERHNPLSLFLYSRVLVSEEAYLDFSSTVLPGQKVLPGIQGRSRQRLISSLSAPTLGSPPLPQISPEDGEGASPA